MLIVMKLKCTSMKLIGAAFGRQRDRRATRGALFGIACSGGDIHCIHHFSRHHVASVVGQPKINRCRAINARHVVVSVCAIDIGPQRTARRIRNRILE